MTEQSHTGSGSIFEMGETGSAFHDPSKRKCTCAPHSPQNGGRKKQAGIDDASASTLQCMETKGRKGKKKKKKAKDTKLEPLERIDGKSPTSVSASLSERRKTAVLPSLHGSLKPRGTPQTIRHVLIPPIDLDQMQEQPVLECGSTKSRTLAGRRKSRRRQRSCAVSKCSSDYDIAIMPFQERDHGAIIPISNDREYAQQEDNTEAQLPFFSPRINTADAITPRHVSMPRIDDAVRHSRVPIDGTKSESMHHFRVSQARQVVEEYKCKEEQFAPKGTDCLEESSDDEADPFAIIVGSFGFAEEGNSQFLKMDVWDTVPVRCNSR
jgi:hypothetical protein